MKKLMSKISGIINFTSLKITFFIWLIIHTLRIPELRLQDIVTRTSIMVKMLHFFFLYLIINNIRRLILERKKEKTKREIIISLIFFAISFTTLLLVWPGVWSWDDIFIVAGTYNYNFNPWQHFFSGLFHNLCVQTIPFNTGVIIMQILIASMITGYIITNLVDIVKIKKEKQKRMMMFLLFIPTILPPVLEYLLGGFRMGIYSFLELLLITKLLICYINKKEIDLKELIEISLLTIVVASWRTEAIYYVGCLFIIFMLYGKKVITIRKSIITTCIVLLCVILVGKYNTHLIGNNDYSITASILPVSELVKKADKVTDKEALDNINQLIDIQMIYDNPNKSGASYYWDGIARDGYTSKDYSDYMKGYLSLAFKYPNVALGSMANNFFKASGIIVKNKKRGGIVTAVNGGSLELFNMDNRGAQFWERTNSFLRHPFSINIRNKVLRLLDNVKENGDVLPLYYFNWNLFIPLIMLVVTTIIMLIRKKWLLSFLGLTIFARVILVFVTACSPYFMYYLSVYLVGYIYSITMIYMLIYDRKKK